MKTDVAAGETRRLSTIRDLRELIVREAP